MSILIEIAKNILIKLPFVKAIAKRRHVTGFNQSVEGIKKIFDTYNQFASFNGKNVIEIGPGHTWGVAEQIMKAGAASVTIIDIERYIPDSVILQNQWLNYKIYSGGNMPLPSEYYDLVLSYTVYEHLRQPEITVQETFRILKKGGMAIHLIDLGDHRYFGIDRTKLFDCLRYGKKLWNLMSWNRSIYVNRIRVSGWRTLHLRAGFTIEKEITQLDDYSKRLFEDGKLRYLRSLVSEDRFASGLLLVLRK